MYVENCDDRFFFVADKSNVVRSTRKPEYQEKTTDNFIT
jgi:hypothetical protein